MREIKKNEVIGGQLEAAEQAVVDRLQELGARLNQDYWPESMGMILAAEGVESRFSLGSSIVKAVWSAELTDEQLASITAKLENKNRLITADASDLEKDILALGRLLSRIKIDMKGIFANAPELKTALLTNILKSVNVIFAEYEKEQSGEVRSIGVRDYFEVGTVTAIDNISKLGKAYPSIDRNIVQLAVDRDKILLDVIRDIGPDLKLDRQKIIALADKYHSILSINFADELELEVCSDAEFAQVLKAFHDLSS